LRQALDRASWSTGDVQRIEINEAFAAIAIAVARELDFPEDTVDVEGGAVAHGHPIGATGAHPDHTSPPLDETRQSQARHRHALHRRWSGHRLGGRTLH
jgi:hypothetical protein